MVFKIYSTGKHIKNINGKPLNHQAYKFDINRNGNNKIFLETKELNTDNNKMQKYENKFDSLQEFMKNLEKKEQY